MEKLIIRTIATLSLLVCFLVLTPAFGQNGEPPPPPAHGETTNQVPGGSAPVGEGIIFLTMLGAAYGSKKWYVAKQKA